MVVMVNYGDLLARSANRGGFIMTLQIAAVAGRLHRSPEDHRAARIAFELVSAMNGRDSYTAAPRTVGLRASRLSLSPR